MSFFQSKANLDRKILFGKIIHHLDPEIRKMLERGMFGSKDYLFISIYSFIYLFISYLSTFMIFFVAYKLAE